MLLIYSFLKYVINNCFKSSGVLHVKGKRWIRVIIYHIHYHQTELKENKKKKKRRKNRCGLCLPVTAEIYDVSLVYKYMNSWLDSFLIKHFLLEKKKKRKKHNYLRAARATVIMTLGLSHYPEESIKTAIFLICHSTILAMCLACDAAGNCCEPIMLQNILNSPSTS